MKSKEIRRTAALKGDRGINKIAMTGLFAALSYVVFTFLQFKITLSFLERKRHKA